MPRQYLLTNWVLSNTSQQLKEQFFKANVQTIKIQRYTSFIHAEK